MTPSVRLVAPPAALGGEKVEGLRREIDTHFREALGWNVKTIRQRVSSSRARGEGMRPYGLLEPTDAYQLYQALHRGPVVVFQMAKTKVLIDPSAGPTERNVLSLREFVRYKALFALASDEEDWHEAIELAQEWVNGCFCRGEGDARVLPLHCFCPSAVWDTLDGDQRGFERIHGKGNARVDSKDRHWNKPNGLHGHEQDMVAGYSLRRGFHWDVEAGDNVSVIGNTKERWSIGKNGYINVYPGGGIRGGKKCRQEFEAERPAPELDGGPRKSQKSRPSRRRKQNPGRYR